MLIIIITICAISVSLFVLASNIRSQTKETTANLEGEIEIPKDLLATALLSAAAQYKFQQKIAWGIFIFSIIFLMISSIYLYTDWISKLTGDQAAINSNTNISKIVLILTEGGLATLAFKLIKYADEKYENSRKELKDLLK